MALTDPNKPNHHWYKRINHAKIRKAWESKRYLWDTLPDGSIIIPPGSGYNPDPPPYVDPYPPTDGGGGTPPPSFDPVATGPTGTTPFTTPGLWSYASTYEVYTVNQDAQITDISIQLSNTYAGEVKVVKLAGYAEWDVVTEILATHTFAEEDILAGFPNTFTFDPAVDVSAGDVIGIITTRTDGATNSNNRMLYTTDPSDWTDGPAFTWEHMRRDQDNDVGVGDFANSIYSSGTRRGSVYFTYTPTSNYLGTPIFQDEGGVDGSGTLSFTGEIGDPSGSWVVLVAIGQNLGNFTTATIGGQSATALGNGKAGTWDNSTIYYVDGDLLTKGDCAVAVGDDGTGYRCAGALFKIDKSMDVPNATALFDGDNGDAYTLSPTMAEGGAIIGVNTSKGFASVITSAETVTETSSRLIDDFTFQSYTLADLPAGAVSVSVQEIGGEDDRTWGGLLAIDPV